MRRLIALGVLVPALVVLLIAGVGATNDGGGAGYKVRAIFTNVAFAVPGEDVKVAGAKVGTIDSLDVTKDKLAVVVLRIDDAAFTPFKTNATCTVRPQSLIGEKFVECDPGTPEGANLIRIEEGDGKGQHLLPVAQTSSPVDLDLVNDTLRLPYRQRLSIILNEFGTGLAGRGDELNKVIHRANPALRETDAVLRTLAAQNRTLAKLATDSDDVLGPLAREKNRVTGFITKADSTGEATAERRGQLEQSVQRLPGTLRELRGLMSDLEGFTNQATPVTRNLNRAGPQLSRFIQQLGPFSRAARPAIKSLGRATDRGRPALLRSRPLVRDLGRFGVQARPVARNLGKLTASLDETGAIGRLMDFFFYSVSSINGFDSVGHYLRASLVANTCTSYFTTEVSGCVANFSGSAGITSASAKASAQLAPRPRGAKPGAPSTAPLLQDLIGTGNKRDDAARKRQLDAVRKRAAAPEAPQQRALDYLLGGSK